MLLATSVGPARAQESSQGTVILKGAFQSPPIAPHSVDLDLRLLPRLVPWQKGDPVGEVPKRLYPRSEGFDVARAQPKPFEPDPLLEAQVRAPSATDPTFGTPILNFDGISFTGAHPSDSVGAAGPNHYIHLVNSLSLADNFAGSTFIIYDKNGRILAGPSPLQSLWIAGGDCAKGMGDPIVLYDRLADRWLMSEVALLGNHLCVYISKTGDPVSGGWFLYDFEVPEGPDSPKYAVWPDAYYVGTNESSPAAYALDRARMLNGQAATFQRFTAAGLGAFLFQMLIPSTLDGPIAPLPRPGLEQRAFLERTAREGPFL